MLANFYIGRQEMRRAKTGRRWIIQNDNQLEHEIQSGLFIVVERRYERSENCVAGVGASASGRSLFTGFWQILVKRL